jgi:hypothetical protein
MIENNIDQIIQYLNSLETEEKIKEINNIRKKIHDISPFKDNPVDLVTWEK